MIRVVLVDDHDLVRRGVREIIHEQHDMRVVGEATSYGLLRELMRDTEFDVLILDVSLPGRSGIEVLETLIDPPQAAPVSSRDQERRGGERIDKGSIKALVLSQYPEDQYAVRALKAGALGYLNKATSAQRVIEAIRTVNAGQKYFTPEIGQALVRSIIDQDQSNAHDRLSDRELQTLMRIAQGKKLSEIADSLMLSPKTVSVYRSRVMEKLGVRSNAEIAAYAVRNGLLA
jgi:DNA-binding NarL/FixJ family response regulator